MSGPSSRSTAGSLTSSDGRYAESGFSEHHGDALVLCAKPSFLVFLHETPAPSGQVVCPTYEVYRYRLEGDRLSMRLIEGGCREYSSRDIDGATFALVV